MQKYQEWIAANVEGNGYGKCQNYCKLMSGIFTELREAKGFFHCVWGARQHYWLVAPDSSIVDPTRGQFPGGGEYEELAEEELKDRCPTGVCMDCGEDVFHKDTFCSPECEEATRTYLRTGVL